MFLLDKSKTSFEDLKEVSQAAHEAKLDRELLRFEEELELFVADKDLFVENLYRRLKQVTSLWRSWRCQRLRDVTVTQLVSTKQIEDLIYWERNLPRRPKDTKVKPADMLVRFLQACHESSQLYEQFFFSIYKPLHQLFADEKAASLAKELGRVLEQWNSLLVPGPINHRMLNAKSFEAVHNMNLKNKPRDTQFNLILRLVPDFAVKGYEVLFLARRWRNILGSSGYSRELKFIHNKKNWVSRHEQPNESAVSRSTFYNLERKLKREREAMDSAGHVEKEHMIDRSASHAVHRCHGDRLDSRSSVQTGLASIASERNRLVTRPLLNSRHRTLTRDQRFHCKTNVIKKGRFRLGSDLPNCASKM